MKKYGFNIIANSVFFSRQDRTLLWTCVASAHLQCVNNRYAKFEYKGMKSVITQCKPSKGGVDVIILKVQHSPKNYQNVHKI